MLFKKENKLMIIMQKHKLFSGIVLVAIVGILIAFGKSGQHDVASEHVSATKTVSLLSLSSIHQNQVVATASGEVESLEQVTLSSEMFGTVSQVYVGIGDKVKAGQLLVQFKANDKAAQYTQSQADYENTLAAKNSLLAQIDAAYANHEKLKINAASSITSAESVLRTAENNLQQVVNTGSNAIVDDVYADTVQTLHSVQDTFVDMLVVADNILGVDNRFANDVYENILGILNSGAFSTAKQNYYIAKSAKELFQTKMMEVTVLSSQATIDAVAVSAKQTLSTYATLFSSLTTLLDNTPPVGDLSQTILTTLISSVNTGRTEITTQQTALANATQAIVTAKKSFATQQIAYDKAVQDLADTKAKAIADIAASEAGLKQIEATLASQDASIKRARGAIAGVSAELAKASVRSPIPGVVANIAVKQGELVSNAAIVADVVNTTGLQVTTYVPAEALSALSVGGIVLVEEKPVGHIVRIAPSINNTTKKVEVIISIDETEGTSFVVGQFVNLQMLASQEDTDVSVLLVPLSAVKVTAESHSVYVVVDGHIVVVPIQTGQLIGDKIEIISDLSEYNAIVSSVRGIEEGDVVSIIE